MPEETQPEAPAGQPTDDPEPSAPNPAGEPPWGSDENFDPQKAWKLIQNLRSEKGVEELEKERQERQKLAEQLEKLTPLQKIAEALGQGDPEKGKTDLEQLTERLSKHEEELASEREARWRAEVANEKGLTAEQAARLVGKTKEELASDADALKALFPSVPGTPKPDPSQGGRGGAGIDLDSRIQEAQKKGDWKTVLSLQNQKLAENHK